MNPRMRRSHDQIDADPALRQRRGHFNAQQSSPYDRGSSAVDRLLGIRPATSFRSGLVDRRVQSLSIFNRAQIKYPRQIRSRQVQLPRRRARRDQHLVKSDRLAVIQRRHGSRRIQMRRPRARAQLNVVLHEPIRFGREETFAALLPAQKGLAQRHAAIRPARFLTDQHQRSDWVSRSNRLRRRKTRQPTPN